MNASLPLGSTALVVIDMQQCFFESPALAVRRDELAQNCAELISQAHKVLAPVLLVQTQHQRDGSTWTRNMRQDDQGFAFTGDQDAFLLPELPTWASVQITKTRDNAFHQTELAQMLTQARISRLVLAGVSTHSCVAVTAAEAYARDFDVVLAGDAIASEKPELHVPILKQLGDEYRQATLTNQEITFD